MGILVECPKCKVRGSVKRKVCKASAQSVSVVADRMRLPSVILQLIKRKYNYKTKLSITKILNCDWLFAMQFLEC